MISEEKMHVEDLDLIAFAVEQLKHGGISSETEEMLLKGIKACSSKLLEDFKKKV